MTSIMRVQTFTLTGLGRWECICFHLSRIALKTDLPKFYVSFLIPYFPPVFNKEPHLLCVSFKVSSPSEMERCCCRITVDHWPGRPLSRDSKRLWRTNLTRLLSSFALNSSLAIFDYVSFFFHTMFCILPRLYNLALIRCSMMALEILWSLFVPSLCIGNIINIIYRV